MKIKEPNEIFHNIYKKITANDILAIIIVFALGIINNFTFFITEGIAPDALSLSDFNIAGNWEVSLGRFGIKFVNLMRFGLVNRFLIVSICLIFLSISVIIIIRIFDIKNKTIIGFIAAIIAVAPQFTETYFFIYCADAYCLAFLLACLTVYFLKKSDIKKKYYIMAGLCTIIVCSLYQAYLGVIIGLTILLIVEYLLRNEDIKEIIVKAIQYLAVIFAGVILYYIILKIIIKLLGISLASYKGANSLGLETVKALPNTIIQTYKDFINFFFTNKIINNSYYNRKIINTVLFIISFTGLGLNLYRGQYKVKCLRALLIMGCLLVFPIGISIMNLIAPNTTINLVTGPGLITSIVLVAIIYNKLDNNSVNNLIKIIYIMMLAILIATFIIENTYTYMCRHETYINYYAISNDIYSKATELSDYSSDKKWMFSNVINIEAKNVEKTNGFISRDSETWNNYSGTLQNHNFFDKYLGIDISMCSRDEYNEIIKTDEFKQMPIYPNKGSVKIINDIVVIKTSNKTF